MSELVNLKIDANVLNNDESMMVIEEAFLALLHTSEADFEKLKNAKWYNRLWEMLTFSNEREKILARNNATLTQMLSIIFQLVKALSVHNRRMALLLDNHSDKIEQLEDAVISLSSRMDAFERKISKKKSHALWVILSLLPFIGGIGLIYAGQKAKRRIWIISGLFYILASITALMLSPSSILMAYIVMALYPICIIHSVILMGPYRDRLAQIWTSEIRL